MSNKAEELPGFTLVYIDENPHYFPDTEIEKEEEEEEEEEELTIYEAVFGKDEPVSWMSKIVAQEDEDDNSPEWMAIINGEEEPTSEYDIADCKCLIDKGNLCKTTMHYCKCGFRTPLVCKSHVHSCYCRDVIDKLIETNTIFHLLKTENGTVPNYLNSDGKERILMHPNTCVDWCKADPDFHKCICDYNNAELTKECKASIKCMLYESRKPSCDREEGIPKAVMGNRSGGDSSNNICGIIDGFVVGKTPIPRKPISQLTSFSEKSLEEIQKERDDAYYNSLITSSESGFAHGEQNDWISSSDQYVWSRRAGINEDYNDSYDID
jgi:hypothetical protein